MYDNHEVKCPKCLKGNDLDQLAAGSEYGCWTSDSEYVSCLHCDYTFEVACEHQGYEPKYDTFDMASFCSVHEVKVPKDTSATFVKHYLRGLIDDGETSLVVSDPPYTDQNPKWESAYHFALKEWARIKGSLGE